MSASRQLESRHVSFVLPVTLSASVRRCVLLATGSEPATEQTFVVGDLIDLPMELRERLVSVWDKLNVHVEEEEHSTPAGLFVDIASARNDGYGQLQRSSTGRWLRWVPHTFAIDLDEVFFATPGRTVRAVEYLRARMVPDQERALDSMFAGAPLVNELGEKSDLRIEDVLDAYEHALDLASQLIAVVDSGTHAGHAGWFDGAFNITDDAIFLHPDLANDPPNQPAAILKQSSAQAYTKAREIVEQLQQLPANVIDPKIDRTCHHWWSARYVAKQDETKIHDLLEVDLANALNDVKVERAKQEATKRYEQCRAEWIVRHGSQRLKRAAARNYRHDGIYRDERLELELPDFVGSLGRKPTIRELVNPSEDALEIESQALARAEALGIPDEKVRLVFVQPGQDSEWVDGEFVQIEGYLGRHTVWKSVSGERSPEDIPF